MKLFETTKQRRRWKRMERRLLTMQARRNGTVTTGPYWLHLDRNSDVMGCAYRDVARWIKMGRIAAFVTKWALWTPGAREIHVLLADDPEVRNEEKRHPRCK